MTDDVRDFNLNCSASIVQDFKCSKCGQNGSKPHCPECGSRVFKDQTCYICPRCGHVTSPKDDYCKECGERVEKRKIREYPAPQSPQELSNDEIFLRGNYLCASCGFSPPSHLGKELKEKYCINCGKRKWKRISPKYWECKLCEHQQTTESHYCYCCGSRMIEKQKEEYL